MDNNEGENSPVSPHFAKKSSMRDCRFEYSPSRKKLELGGRKDTEFLYAPD